MGISNQQVAQARGFSGSDDQSESGEIDMTYTAHARAAARFILQSRPKLLAGLRLVPVALVLVGTATMAPSASATACSQPSNVAVNGGTVSNETTIDLSADGGIAVSNASGGDDNIAVGGNGGPFGNGGNAAAGNGGVAVAEANGGMIDLDDINSGDNTGNTIAVSTSAAPCGYAPSNVAINGGTVSNETTIDLSADGGTAVSNANGGDDNIAVGGNGGPFGNGGNAAAGNGGIAVAEANGGAITVGNINSGNNRGNTILVGLRSGGWFGRASNVRINGGTVRNTTTIAISAEGGTAVSNANGGDDNIAVGGNGGAFGDGGNAAAGNGGVAVAEANGGTVTVGNINSGGNSGNSVVVQGSQGGNVVVDGGTVTNETTIDISADGGTAVADASGGDGNVAVGGNGGDFGDGGDAAAGNGGVAISEANGGDISVGNIDSGGNTGNTIIVGN
jgi:hypothetical protein